MFKKFSLFMLLVLVVAFAAACGNNNEDTSSSVETESSEATAEVSEEITISHLLGETTVTVNPEKVVVFDFGVLDSLDKLGVEVTAVPQTNIPTYLSKYEDSKYENVGSLKEPDFEKLAEIEPDLIIISGRQQDMYEELNELGPTIFMGLDTTRYMESFKENMTTLGKIFGKETEIEQEIAAVEAPIATLNEKASANESKGLIVLANEGNLSAYGPGSRFGIIHDVFGVKPADEQIEVSTHGQNVSPEYIVEKDPDYLFVIDRGAAVGGESSAKTIVENELVKNTKAYKNEQIIYLDPNYWYLSGGGLISVSEMVKEIEEGLK